MNEVYNALSFYEIALIVGLLFILITKGKK
jgi:hypothetical protein